MTKLKNKPIESTWFNLYSLRDVCKLSNTLFNDPYNKANLQYIAIKLPFINYLLENKIIRIRNKKFKCSKEFEGNLFIYLCDNDGQFCFNGQQFYFV